ncbi:MAG: hypothetical protein ACI9UU_003332 [Candidatus Azotimanducaceae bacterium]
MHTELVATTASWILIGVFLPAVVHKIKSWPRFLASMQAYKLLPVSLVKPAAMVLVGLEISALVLLAGGPFVGLASVGFIVAMLLLGVYFVAILVNVLRGRQFIDCGCGDDPTAIGWLVLLRNLMLVAVASLGWFLVVDSAGIELTAYLLGICLALIGWGLYQAAEQLLANRTTHQRLWMGL